MQSFGHELQQAADNREMLQKCAAVGAAADQAAVQKAEEAFKAFAAEVVECEKSVKNAVRKS